MHESDEHCQLAPQGVSGVPSAQRGVGSRAAIEGLHVPLQQAAARSDRQPAGTGRDAANLLGGTQLRAEKVACGSATPGASRSRTRSRKTARSAHRRAAVVSVGSSPRADGPATTSGSICTPGRGDGVGLGAPRLSCPDPGQAPRERFLQRRAEEAARLRERDRDHPPGRHLRPGARIPMHGDGPVQGLLQIRRLMPGIDPRVGHDRGECSGG